MKKKFVGALALASTLALAACSNNSAENVATTKYGNVTKDDLLTSNERFLLENKHYNV